MAIIPAGTLVQATLFSIDTDENELIDGKFILEHVEICEGVMHYYLVPYVYRPQIIARSSNGDVKTTYLDEVFGGNNERNES